MTRVVDVSTICFEPTPLKGALEGRELEGAGELKENDDDGAEKRERD